MTRADDKRAKVPTDAQINAARGMITIDNRLSRRSRPDVVAIAQIQTSDERRRAG